MIKSKNEENKELLIGKDVAKIKKTAEPEYLMFDLIEPLFMKLASRICSQERRPTTMNERRIFSY